MPLDNISELKKRVPGGKYALTRAVAERARQLQNGATPLTEVKAPNPLSVAIDEIVQGKVTITVASRDTEPGDVAPAGSTPDGAPAAPSAAASTRASKAAAREATRAADRAQAAAEASAQEALGGAMDAPTAADTATPEGAA
jgi:DNA-directed RNA polymerase subunit omega